MVTTKESQTCHKFSAWNLPNTFDHMALLQRENISGLPYFPAGVAFPGQPNSDLCCLNSSQPNAVDGSFKPLPPSVNPCLKDSQFAPQKRFLIFDRSGNETRLFFSSPSFPPKDQITALKTPAIASRLDHRFLVKPIVDEKWDESHLNDGEGDQMLEDSEEIDALLYSDSDNDDISDNDEVTSTRDFTFITDKEGFDDKDTFNKEDVASSDGSPKRQRLIDGRYKKPSMVGLSSYENDDAESSYAGPANFDDDIGFSKREKKVKMCKALKILESIIPGLESNNPISIIDKAIAYLESMKIEAEALGVGYT